jgi:hypothetical protein
MTRCQIFASSPLALALAGALATFPVLAQSLLAQSPSDKSAPAAPAPQAPASASLTLKRIAEIRALEVARPAQDDNMFTTSSDEPALQLTFALNLPKGLKLMSLTQPAQVTATDSAGTDLSKIEPAFSGDVEYLEAEHHFGDEDQPHEITMTLAPSARAATTFSVNATFNVLIYAGTQPLEIALGKEWTSLDAKVLGKEGVQARVTDDGLEIKPADANTHFEAVQLPTGASEVIEANGWFSDSQTLTYMMSDLPKERPLKVRFVVRTGVQTIPLSIDVKQQALP